MGKWKTVRVQHELAEEAEKEVETGKYRSLSAFVSDAIKTRLQTLTEERIPEYLERDRSSRTRQLQTRLRYTTTHLCVDVTPQYTVRIGITEHFQRRLREIVNILTADVGETVTKDEPFGVVESWWFTHDLESPLNGTIVAVNQAVLADPFLLNLDPYQWIVEVKPRLIFGESWMRGLLTFSEYEQLVTQQT